MKPYLILLLMLVTSFAFGANIGDDKLNLGDGNNPSTDKEIIFNDGTTSKKKLSIDGTTKNLKSNSDTLELGDGTQSDKSIIFNRGGSNATILWDETLDKLRFAKDGVTFKDFGSGSGSGGSGIELLVNSSFEDAPGGVISDWTTSGGTLTQVAYDDPSENNLSFARYVASGAAQSVCSADVTVPSFVTSGLASRLRYNQGDNAFKLQIQDGSSNVLSEFTLGDLAQFERINPIWAPIVATGSIVKVCVVSTAAGTIDIDDASLNAEGNLVQIAQAKLAGEAFFAPAASATCSRTSTTSGPFTCNAAFPGPTIVRSSVGSWQTTDANLPRVTVNNLPKGIYKAKFLVPQFMNSAAFATLSINDGTSTCQPVVGHDGTGIAIGQIVECSFEYTTSGNRVFELYGASSTSTINIVNDSTTAPASIKFILEYWPDDSQSAVTSDQSGWFIDANIGGANPSTALNQATYTEITDAGLDLVLNSGSAPAKIPCSGTNPATGLTCLAGNESIGINFNPPHAGYFDVCFNLSIFHSGAANTQHDVILQAVETINSGQTIIQEGKTKSQSQVRANSSVASGTFPHSNCGTFYFSSTAERTVRVMYEALAAGVPNVSQVWADRSGSLGQHDIRITVRPSTMNVARPVLAGTPKKFQEKILASNVTTNGNVASLGFNGLTVSKWYRVCYQAMIISSDGAFSVIHGSTALLNGRTRVNTNQTVSGCANFQATTSTTTANFNIATGTLLGDGTKGSTFVAIEEIEPLEVTTIFN